MEPIRINIATFDFMDKKIAFIMSAVAIAIVLITALNVNLFLTHKNKISEYESKIGTIEEQMSKNEAAISTEELDKIRLRAISANQIIVKDGIPWSRFFEIVETKVPGGMFIERISPTNDYQTLIIEGKAKSERKITFFMKRLKEIEFLRNSILSEFSIGSDADGRFKKEGADISFRIKNDLLIENLFEQRNYRQTIKEIMAQPETKKTHKKQ